MTEYVDELDAAGAEAFWLDPDASDADGVVAALRSLGAEVEDLDDDRVGALIAAAGTADSPLSTAHGATSDRRWRRMGLGAAAAVVTVVAMLGLLTVGGNDRVVVAAADDATIVLADGTTFDVAIGVEIPDGAVVEVDGFIDVGDGPLGPGRYVVDGGELILDAVVVTSSTMLDEPDRAPATTTTPSPSPDARTTPSTSTATDRTEVETDDTERPADSSGDGAVATRPTSTDVRPTTTAAPDRTTVPSRPAVTVDRPVTTVVDQTTTIVARPPATTTAPTTAAPATTVARDRPASTTSESRRGDR